MRACVRYVDPSSVDTHFEMECEYFIIFSASSSLSPSHHHHLFATCVEYVTFVVSATILTMLLFFHICLCVGGCGYVLFYFYFYFYL